MSIRLPPPLRVETVIGALDDAAREAARQAGNLTVAAVRQGMPARLGGAQKSAVRRTPTGYAIEVSPSSRVKYGRVTAKQVTRFREGGTGVYGPRGRPIRPRAGGAFHLPGGWVSGELRGQPARHHYQRAQSSTEALVERTLALGAQRGAMLAERALSRSSGR
jgi:hypothetical protein